MNKTGFWYRLVHLNPALFRGLVMATVLLFASVGIRVSPEVPDSVILFLGAVFAIVQALWTAPSVTSNEKVVVYVPDPVNKPGEVAPGNATTSASNFEILEAAEGTPSGGALK